MTQKQVNPYINPYETCPDCNGSGLALNMAGEPDVCRNCMGDTVVRARDEKGRFIGNSSERRP